MKSCTHSRITVSVILFILVLVPTILLVFGAAVPPEKRGELVTLGLFLTISVGVPVVIIANEFQRKVPNGLPRPEDELPRKQVFSVSARIGDILHLVPYAGGALIFWRFANLTKEVEPGKQIVHLDNLETEFLAIWKERGVIPILSARSRAKTETKKDEHTEACKRFSEAMS